MLPVLYELYMCTSCLLPLAIDARVVCLLFGNTCEMFDQALAKSPYAQDNTAIVTFTQPNPTSHWNRNGIFCTRLSATH